MIILYSVPIKRITSINQLSIKNNCIEKYQRHNKNSKIKKISMS